jgi:hypothetical protein
MKRMIGIILTIFGALLFIMGIVFINTDPKAITKTNLAEESIADTNLPAGNADRNIVNTNLDKKEETELDNIFDLVLADGILTEGEKKSIQAIAQKKNLNYDGIIADLEDKLKTNGIEAEAQLIDRNKKNGDEFEKFVAQKFDKRLFKIKEWTGDKYVNGVYAENTLHPDMLLQFELKGISKSFAVECKWRKELYKNGVEFAKPDQLKRYKKYEAEKRIPVFIAIGVKGKASDPENLFIVPLKEVKTTFLDLDTLKKYEKNKVKNFYFDPNAETLR